MMPPLTIYGTPDCPACTSAKEKATELGLPFSFVDIYEDDKASFMFSQRNFNTVPQIFRGEELIGGLTDFLTFISNSK